MNIRHGIQFDVSILGGVGERNNEGYEGDYEEDAPERVSETIVDAMENIQRISASA